MNALLGIIAPFFWGFVLLSALVFVHEGGHFLAARACGVRVTEFFLGMPCRFNLHRVSRRIGTKFGITPILLGGYAEICGMDPTEVACAPAVLTYVHEHGVATVAQIARDLELSEEDALDACALLMGWGSVAPRYDEAAGERPGGSEYPSTFAAMPRDASGSTIFDGRRFERDGATQEGECWVPPMGQEAFFVQERSRTYSGKGFWKRAFMLLAGIGVNILTGFLLIVTVYSVLGTQVVVDTNRIGAVLDSSPASEAGLAAGDAIVSVNGAVTETWSSILDALSSAQAGQQVSLEVAGADGRERSVSVELGADGMLGIEGTQETVRLNPLDSCRIALDSIAQTAQGVARLLNPSQTMEVLDSSTSIVGISVMSAQAAAAGPAVFLSFAALISFSLGFMNLLPIPPLDGGRLLIEAIQAATGRTVPLRVQSAISIVGIVLFAALFLYMFRADVLRFF